MTTDEAAKRLHMDAAHVRRLCLSNKIAADRYGRNWWITDDALATFIEKRAAAPHTTGWPAGKPRKTKHEGEEN